MKCDLVSLINWFPVVIVFALLSFCWGVFMYEICYPIMVDHSLAWSIIYIVIFNILLLLVLLSYMRAVFTTSYVPKNFSHPSNVFIPH